MLKLRRSLKPAADIGEVTAQKERPLRGGLSSFDERIPVSQSSPPRKSFAHYSVSASGCANGAERRNGATSSRYRVMRFPALSSVPSSSTAPRRSLTSERSLNEEVI